MTGSRPPPLPPWPLKIYQSVMSTASTEAITAVKGALDSNNTSSPTGVTTDNHTQHHTDGDEEEKGDFVSGALAKNGSNPPTKKRKGAQLAHQTSAPKGGKAGRFA